MTRFALSWAPAALLLVAGAGISAGSAQEGERPAGLFDLIFGGSERMAGDRTAPQGVERTAQASPSDLTLRVDRLEAQIRQLTGIIEQLQYRNQQLEAQLRRVQEGPPGQTRPGVATGSPPPAAPGRRGDAFDPTQNPNAPGAPHALGAMPPHPPQTPGQLADASVGAPPGRAHGAPADVAGSAPGTPRYNPGAGTIATLAPSDAPKDEFDLAYGYVLRRDFTLAEESFRSFLAKHPNDRLAGDATFWLGESLFQRQRFRDAAESFLNVSTKFEGNAKAPDALLRLGQSLAALGEKEAACASLGEVLRKYPRASAGVKQGVEREQKRVRC